MNMSNSLGLKFLSPFLINMMILTVNDTEHFPVHSEHYHMVVVAMLNFNPRQKHSIGEKGMHLSFSSPIDSFTALNRN